MCYGLPTLQHLLNALAAGKPLILKPEVQKDQLEYVFVKWQKGDFFFPVHGKEHMFAMMDWDRLSDDEKARWRQLRLALMNSEERPRFCDLHLLDVSMSYFESRTCNGRAFSGFVFTDLRYKLLPLYKAMMQRLKGEDEKYFYVRFDDMPSDETELARFQEFLGAVAIGKTRVGLTAGHEIFLKA